MIYTRDAEMEETEGPMVPAPGIRRDRLREALPGAAHDMDRDELSRLIREANDSGISFGQMAERAEAAGHPVSKPYFQKLSVNAVTRAPTPDTMQGMAAALRQPLSVVQRAAARQFLDYQATELSGYDDDVRVIVAHLAGMRPGEKKRWRAMIEAVEQVEDD